MSRLSKSKLFLVEIMNFGLNIEKLEHIFVAETVI